MKYSTVTPVHKKGVFTDPSNYRPISVVTSFAKVLEMALYERMVEYISYNSIMTDQQFGFRKGYSTDEAIFKLVYEVLNALNDKSKVGSIFLDLEKAFDSVNHSLLIKKLSCYGINGKAKQLIESYLSNRYQRVILKKIQEQTPMWSQNGKVSSTESPRAQYWAPCFFCYTLMTCQRQPHLGQFQYNLQDDTRLLIASSNTCELQKEFTTSLLQLNKWFQQNFLTLNVSKTYFFLIPQQKSEH